MPLPIILIAERHHDSVVNKIIQRLKAPLAAQGYNTLCIEQSSDFELHEIIQKLLKIIEESRKWHDFLGEVLTTHHKATSEELVAGLIKANSLDNITQFVLDIVKCDVSKAGKIADQIKMIDSNTSFLECLRSYSASGWSIKGVDITRKEFEKYELEKDLQNYKKATDERDATILNAILNLFWGGYSLVVKLGGAHANHVINILRRLNLGNEVLVYFPHSGKQIFSADTDEMAEYLDTICSELKGYDVVVSDEDSVDKLVGKIVLDVKKRNSTYIAELEEGTSITRLLTYLFNVKVLAKERRGHYIDACIPIESTDMAKNAVIQQRLNAVQLPNDIRVIDNKEYIVIPEVNTSEVNSKLSSLK